jgi:hypothetical protein
MNQDDELRQWAKGNYAYEAATELLIRAFHGRFTSPAWPWITPDRDHSHPWIDFHAIPDNIGMLSSGEQRLLLITASIAGEHPTSLGDALTGLDRDTLDLILAAAAHAGGSHEHSEMTWGTNGRGTLTRAGTLHPWPDPKPQKANLSLVPCSNSAEDEGDTENP